MKTNIFHLTVAMVLVLAALFGQGCASGPQGFYAHHYLQRTPVRVAVIPSENKTDKPEAAITLDKAWEAALTKAGFEVVNADQVVTYASTVGVALQDLKTRPSVEVGRDLKVDALLFNQITEWDTKYVVLKTFSQVAGTSRLVEASTGGLIFEHHWINHTESGNGGGGLVGLLADAAVTAIIHSTTDELSQLAQGAVSFSSGQVPRPGFAPKTAPETPQ